MVSMVSWLSVVVGCALSAAALASEEASMLDDDLGNPTPEFPIPKLNISLTPHANATKGSVVGTADPGYGQPSAGRTDEQRKFEEEEVKRGKNKRGPLDPLPGQDYNETTQKINNNIEGRIQEAVDKENQKRTAVSTLTAIKRQSVKIKHKFRTAKRMIKEKIKADKLAAKVRKEKAEEESEEEEGKTAGDGVAFAVRAEEQKLKQQELKNGVDTNAPVDKTGVALNAKIDIAPSGNWVRPGRPEKKKKALV